MHLQFTNLYSNFFQSLTTLVLFLSSQRLKAAILIKILHETSVFLSFLSSLSSSVLLYLLSVLFLLELVFSNQHILSQIVSFLFLIRFLQFVCGVAFVFSCRFAISLFVLFFIAKVDLFLFWDLIIMLFSLSHSIKATLLLQFSVIHHLRFVIEFLFHSVRHFWSHLQHLLSVE